MTLSILMYDKEHEVIGCAAATGNLAVGAWVLRAEAGVGAVATQGLSVSTLWGDKAMDSLSEGTPPEVILQRLTLGDPGREHRQVSILDWKGRVAAWTGNANEAVCDQILGDNYVIAGNWLSSPEVLPSMKEALIRAARQAEGEPGEVLLRVLEAGVSAGSDSRGTLSAALKIVSRDRPPLDLRIDYDEEPLARLRQLYARATSAPYSTWVERVPTLAAPHRF